MGWLSAVSAMIQRHWLSAGELLRSLERGAWPKSCDAWLIERRSLHGDDDGKASRHGSRE